MKVVFICLMMAIGFCKSVYSQNAYNSQESVYVDGREVLSYVMNDIELYVTAGKTNNRYGFGKEIVVDIMFKNNKDESIEFNPGLIDASYSKKGKLRKLKVYSENDYMKKVNKNILLWGPDNTKNIQTKTEVKDNNGNKVGEVSTTSQIYTGDADDAYNDMHKYIKDCYIKRNTVFPSKEVRGFMVIESFKGDSFNMSIDIDSNKYCFSIKFEN